MIASVALLLSLLAVAVAQLNVSVNVGTHHKLIECRHGLFLINRADSWIGRSLDVYGEWAEEEIKLLSHFIEEGDIVADVGANIGTFTVPMAKMVGSSAPEHHLALNEITNVGVFTAGVGNSDKPLEVPDVIYTNEANFGSISLLDDWKAKGASTSLVPQLQLDDVFANSCPSFIKIDVEGMELMVLQGAEQTLQRCHPTLYLENNCKRGSKELIQYTTDLGYTCHWDVHPYFREGNFRQNPNNIFSDAANSMNMICFSMNNPRAVEKAGILPSISKIDPASGRFMLHEYGLSYTGKEDVVLSQQGTLDSCER